MFNFSEVSHASLRRIFDELADLPLDQRQKQIEALDLAEWTRARLIVMLLFDELSQMSDHERRKALEERPLSDFVRARLKSMLLLDAQAPESVKMASAEALRDLVADADSFNSSLIGTCIGDFQLMDVIGEGGSSTVFRARREVGPGFQTVALKLLRTGLYSADAQRRFRREQAILAQLTHPNIAGLIEGGVSSAGIPYIAMELIEGTPITRAANLRGLGIDQRLTWFVKLCRTIEAAHTSLVVHRDLKPSNLLITKDGELKVVDFGIAKLLDSAELHTRTSSVSLTPQYAAPEQFGHAPLTTAVDIYALGVVLGELLTGLRLGGGVRASAKLAAADPGPGAIPTGLPHSPALVRILRGDLDSILSIATAEDPGVRYISAGALADDVERYVAGKPVRAHPQSKSYRVRKFTRRHRLGIAVASMVALAVLLSAGVAVWQARIAGQQRDIARSERDVARLESRLNGALYDFLVGLFRDGVRDEDKLDPREFLMRGVAWLKTHSPEDAASRALVYSVLGELQVLREDPAGARALLQPLLDNHSVDLPSSLEARLKCTLAQAEEVDGKLERAKQLAEEGIALVRNSTGSARTTLLTCRAVVGTVLADLNQYDEAAAALRTALAEAPLDSNDSDVLALRSSLEQRYAAVLYYSGRMTEAIAHNQSSLNILSHLKRDNSSEALSTLGNLAIAQLNAGQVLAANASFDRVITLSEQFGSSVGFSQRLVNAASTKVVLEQPDAAISLLDRADAMLDSLSATTPRIRAQANLERGKALLLRREFNAAEHFFEIADKAIDAGYPPGHFWRGYTAEQRARSAMLQANYTEAETELARAIDRFGKGDGSAKIAAARAQALAVELSLLRLDAAGAAARLDIAEPMADATLERGHWRRAWINLMRARTLSLLGQKQQAQPMFDPAYQVLAKSLGPGHSLARRAEIWAADANPPKPD